ncbi:sulfate ABC transporter ATP-binding protein, partial [Mesorhizobium qingshengii]|nr:sulfate ABC transporter ATP-binding protein [Mesorhizobium qingshengii]
LEIGGDRQRVEIELPVDHPAAQKSRVAFRPGRWTLFPASSITIQSRKLALASCQKRFSERRPERLKSTTRAA